ncbi:MAG: MoaD/ThiS family protein [Candidatus Nitrohelix vancouverensis]|uniref:MoaD/ThiS family protein n=1 Tax=Candidatus Nitrohelix vancouverensis TaxID=2705534 RepID=A0A7T0C4P0_9BACT|nr:MAG: MoaD/ThiS family protein [Candidatus Nitrohelix vancouverensis]
MKIIIPSPLYSYTQKREVEAVGSTLASLVDDLDRQYPGLKFRIIDEQNKIRPHMRFFVNDEQVFDLNRPVLPEYKIQIIQALSGG